MGEKILYSRSKLGGSYVLHYILEFVFMIYDKLALTVYERQTSGSLKLKPKCLDHPLLAGCSIGLKPISPCVMTSPKLKVLNISHTLIIIIMIMGGFCQFTYYVCVLATHELFYPPFYSIK